MFVKDGVRVRGGTEARAVARGTEEPGRDEVGLRVDRASRMTASSASQLQRSAGNRATVRAFERAREVATLLPADHPDERAADRLAAGALAGGRARAPERLPTARGRGGGRPLAPGVRAEMEGAFGAGFGAVRVHDDARADGLSRSIGALAFTTGPDIFVRRGAPDPASAAGRRLIAHELAHVVQQARRPTATPIIHRYTLVASEQDGGPVAWSADNSFVRQVSGEQDYLADGGAEEAKVAEHSGEEGVTLKVSEGYELAVEAVDEKSQAKAYYSTAERLEDTNEKLAAVRSAFEMAPQTGETVTLTRPDAGKVTLQKVFPRNLTTPKRSERTPKPEDTEVTEGLSMRARQQCIELAEAVTGRTTDTTKEATMTHADDVGLDYAALGGLLLDVGVTGTGEMNTSNQRGAIRNFLLSLGEISASNPTAVAVASELRARFEELQDCLLRDADPSLELTRMLVAYLETDQYQEVPELAKIESLASKDELAGLPGQLRDVHRAARQFAVWRELKRVRASEDGAETALELGIDEYARPEVGEAYKITYLQREEGDWNYHWAGVVARDGDDSVTLENYTRDTRPSESRFRDARWYFDMYGIEAQSFHAVYSKLGHGQAMTAVYASKPKVARTSAPMSDAVERSRAFAGRLAAIRRQLVQDSGRRHNAAYLDIIRLLNECATLAIDAAEAPSEYKTLVDRADLISLAYDAAVSTKRGARTDRNAALEAMRRDLVALKKEVFRVYLDHQGG